jgi:hypothetical protein
MNHKRDLITDGPTLSIQACDDGVWLHFTTLDGKLHCSLNLPVKFAQDTYLYDSVICQWAHDFAIKNEDAPQNAMEEKQANAQEVSESAPTDKQSASFSRRGLDDGCVQFFAPRN